MSVSLERVFTTLTERSLAALWVVAAVLVLRLVFRKAPKWVHCALWALVALRLVFSLNIESPLSLQPRETEELAETLTGYSQTAVSANVTQEETESVLMDDDGNGSAFPEPEEYTLAYRSDEATTRTVILSRVWLVGMGAMLAYAAYSYVNLRKRVAASLPLDGETAGGAEVRLCDEIATPFILGVARPRVYLPSGMDAARREMVLAHERAHLKRRDHWWKPLGFALLAVYWFNPGLWLAYILLCRDIELACDERVLRELGVEAKKPYAEALLACSAARRAVSACPVAFGETGVKERVKAALNYKKPAFWVIAAAVIACAAAAVCFLTDPAEKQDLSFLNYKNLVSLAAQSETLSAYRSDDGNAYRVDGKAMARYLDSAEWKEWKGVFRSPQREIENSGAVFAQVTLDGANGLYLKVFDSGTAMVVDGNASASPRCYRAARGDYETLLALLQPEDAAPEEPTPVYTWVDHYGEDTVWEAEKLTLTLPEFPDVMFTYTPGEIRIAGMSGVNRLAYSMPGMPVWNAFFADLTGDGVPELCATVSFGSGMVDEHVEVFDAVTWQHYALWNRGEYDYALSAESGVLTVRRRPYHGWSDMDTGTLRLIDGHLTFVRFAKPQNNAFTNIMGFDGYCKLEVLVPHHYLQTYIANVNGEARKIAESFGFETDDHIVDLDGDGVTELVCNCVYGGDLVARIYVYRRNGNTIERGSIDYDKVNMTAWENRGMGSTAERYDPASGRMLVEYASLASSSGDGTSPGTFTVEAGYDALVWEKYAELGAAEQRT